MVVEKGHRMRDLMYIPLGACGEYGTTGVPDAQRFSPFRLRRLDEIGSDASRVRRLSVSETVRRGDKGCSSL
jgi:hypothetical protein